MMTQPINQQQNHPFRKNRFAGFCYRCKCSVPAAQGALIGHHQNGRWQVVHIGCTTEEEWEGAANDAYSRRGW